MRARQDMIMGERTNRYTTRKEAPAIGLRMKGLQIILLSRKGEFIFELDGEAAICKKFG